MAIIAILSIPASLLIWFLVLRPYARSHGGGYTPGANIAITAWVDWQHAKETAKARQDRNIVWMCRWFLALSLATPAIFLLMIIRAAAD